ncbi:hypothetical protein AC249_AIPGENE3247 [Exaiptasia diaphana]|nr:hypothetical protein AC249_AIPGENE3247 [Exaiptasia diaphana]
MALLVIGASKAKFSGIQTKGQQGCYIIRRQGTAISVGMDVKSETTSKETNSTSSPIQSEKHYFYSIYMHSIQRIMRHDTGL